MIHLKNLSRILAIVIAIAFMVGITARSQAQLPGTGRSFVFTPGPVTTLNPSPVVKGNVYSFSANTTVNIVPFLYITGSLDVTVDVTGWGSGTATFESTVDVYHNMGLTIGATGFGNPTSSVSANPIPMDIRGSINPAPGPTTFGNWFDWQSATTSVSTATEGTSASLGHFILDLSRRITISPTVGPTTTPYVNTGASITFTPNWN